jgi:hypothetical protein
VNNTNNIEVKFFAAIPGESFTWNYQMTEPEAHEVNRRQRKPRKTQHSRPPAQPAAEPIFEESPLMDGPMYEMPDIMVLVPDHRFKTYNHEHSGYMALIETTYQHLQSVNSRLSRLLPLSVFTHTMVEYLWARILTR